MNFNIKRNIIEKLRITSEEISFSGILSSLFLCFDFFILSIEYDTLFITWQ